VIEQIDVLVPDGKPAGIRKPKDAIHRDGDLHRAAHVWIIATDGRILLQRRSLRKENNPGESAIDAAVRETQEELGLTIVPAELEFVASLQEKSVLNDGKYIDNEIHEIFLVRRDVDVASLALDPEEVAEVKWVDQLRPDATFVPHAEEYALLSRLVREDVQRRA